MTDRNWTPRERVLAILNKEQPDRVPWFGDLDYWATGLRVRGVVGADFVQSQAYVDWHRDLRVGFYLQGTFPFRVQYDGSIAVKKWREGNLRYRQFDTPYGQLRDCWQWIEQSCSEAPIEHLIKTSADLAVMTYIIRHQSTEPDYDALARRRKQVGEQGIVLGYMPRSPFMDLLVEDCGIETLTLLQLDAQEQLAELMEVKESAHDLASAITVDSPAEALMIPENLSAEMVGPQNFEKYLRRYQTRWAKNIAAAGKYSFVHMDGTLRGLLKQECSVGLTVLEALTPEPVGDVAIEQWADYAGESRTIFWGGLPGVYFTPLIDDAEFDRQVIDVLAVMSQEPRYVLGVADQVPPDALEARVRRVADLVDRYGRYSSR
ncbi:MAG TPA: uroporphyrinogen decarboxylase family protein [bacterium]|nr:uroporphyrinogen decarboxylase family protein [bacterium]HPG45662.1 uroporphyrinogen decarboxylase family protein [bacterium]HPM97559.1 uroporphyrinogen decarboxylase family protein [bacterium]